MSLSNPKVVLLIKHGLKSWYLVSAVRFWYQIGNIGPLLSVSAHHISNMSISKLVIDVKSYLFRQLCEKVAFCDLDDICCLITTPA